METEVKHLNTVLTRLNNFKRCKLVTQHSIWNFFIRLNIQGFPEIRAWTTLYHIRLLTTK